jgi:hypothetical protein
MAYNSFDYDRAEELENDYINAFALFEVARLEMELINAEEARKAEEAAYALLIETRE